MKALFFIDTLASGGKERRLIELIKQLSLDSHHELTVVVIKKDVHYREIFDFNVKIIFLEKCRKNDIKLFWKFYKIVKEVKPDFIHAWSNMVVTYSLFASKILGIPLINSQISDCLHTSKKLSFYNLSRRLNFFFSTVIIANSEAGKISYNPPLKKSKVILNGVDVNRFTIEDKVKDTFKIVMTGTFSENKDYDLFLDVAKRIYEIHPEIKFIGIGGGKNFERINKRIEREKIKNIELTGRVSNVEEIVSCCTIGILFSPHGEGISNAILEYMGFGLPVIATNKGGNKELIVDGKTGFLVEENDIEVIVQKIAYLYTNKEKCFSLGREGRKRLEECFTLSRMTKDFMKVYQDYIHDK
ncbi:MAG: glycosyltransferase [bacterium]